MSGRVNRRESGRQRAPSAILRRFGSLGWRILFWMSVVAFGPLVVMAYQGYHCARQALVESEQTHLQSVLESRQSRIEAWLAGLEADLRFLARSHCVRRECAVSVGEASRSPSDEVCGLVDEIQQGMPLYETILVYDRDWRPLVRVTEGYRTEDILPPEFMSDLSSAEGFVVESVQQGEDGTLRLHVGRPVMRMDGGSAGYVVADLHASEAVDPILRDRTGLGETGRAYLLSSDGRYLTSPSGSAEDVGRMGNVPPGILAGSPSVILGYEDAAGRRVIGVSTVIAALNWTLVAEIDQAEAFAWLGILRTRALVTGAITLVIVLLLTVRSASRLSQPLRELAAVSRDIAGGRHEARVGHLDGAEAEEVGRAFNRMMDEVAATHQRLVHAASLAAVGELSSSIVHEMRSPLTSVKMNLQALRRRVEGYPTHRELADIASSQVARLEKMLADLLSYGKPIRLNPVSIEFEAIVKDVLVTVREEMEKKGVSIEIQDGTAGSKWIADPEQLRRALTNLVANAIQAVPQGGEVRVAAAIPPEAPDSVTILVSDSGPGISESETGKLFQPFFTTREEGTGLGLANVKKVVDYHGGTISLENRPEGGAVFSITLPRGGPSA